MTAPERLDAIDRVLKTADRAVWVITSRDEHARGGLVATFVVSLSIDRERPLLAASIHPDHFTHGLIERSGVFVAHLLRPDQAETAWRFGLSSGASGDKLAGLAIDAGPETGAPRLVDCLGWVEGRCVGRIALAGRTLFVAELVAGDLSSSSPPLTERALIAAATAAQRATLKAQLAADVERTRPLVTAWLATMMNASARGADPASDRPGA